MVGVEAACCCELGDEHRVLMCSSLCLSVTEETDSGLNCFVRVNVKVSCLEGPACWSTILERKSSVLWVAAAIL